MSNHNPLSDSEVAFTAINLFRNKPRGAVPEWHELEDFRAHALSDERLSEILSHVANDPEQFQLWRDLKDASDWVDVESVAESDAPLSDAGANADAAGSSAVNKSIGERFQGLLDKVIGRPLPALGGAVAAALLAVLVVPNLTRGPAPGLDDMIGSNFDAYLVAGAELPEAALISRVTRNSDLIFGEPTAEQADRHHLRLGMQMAFLRMGDDVSDEWAAWHGELPVESLACTDASESAHCVEKANDHISLGQWALMSYFACQGGKMGSGQDFWQTQSDIYTAFEARASVKDSAIVNSIFARGSPPATEQELCSVVDDIVSAGL